MPTILQKAIKLLLGDTKPNVDWLKIPKNHQLKSLTERDLIKLESEIGSRLFGPIPEGRRREFFCLDEKTWIWHEEWLDEQKHIKVATTRYEIQEKGVLKVQEGARYSFVEGEELKNLVTAIHSYYEQVARRVYGTEPKKFD